MDRKQINIFDFDGTLTTETWPKCLVWIKKFGYNGERRNKELEEALTEYRKQQGDSLETFFAFFNDLLVDNKATLTFNELMEGEQYLKYNPGLLEFLTASTVPNYIISGGLKDFLKNINIAKYFENIYGSEISYNNEGLISGIKDIMTDDKKILAIKDILKINKREQNDCHNVYYIGDGYSDMEAMRYVHNNGGKAVFVFHELADDLFLYNNEIYKSLKKEGIIDFYCLADFRIGGRLANILQGKK